MVNGTEPVVVQIESNQQSVPVPVKSVVSGSIKEMVVRWIFDQSVSTVLLIAILVVGIYGIPNYILPAVGDGYKHNAAVLERSIQSQNESREKVAQLMFENCNRDRALFERALIVMERRP